MDSESFTNPEKPLAQNGIGKNLPKNIPNNLDVSGIAYKFTKNIRIKGRLTYETVSGDLTSKHRSHGSADLFEDVNGNQLSST